MLTSRGIHQGRLRRTFRAAFAFALVGLFTSTTVAATSIRAGDRITIIGNTFADQLRVHGYFETLLLQLVCYQGLLQRRQLLLRLALRAHVERERCQHTSAYVSTPASLTCKPLCTVSPDLLTN